MDGRLTWTDCDEAGDYVVPNVLSPRDLVSRPDNMDETETHGIVISPCKPCDVNSVNLNDAYNQDILGILYLLMQNCDKVVARRFLILIACR